MSDSLLPSTGDAAKDRKFVTALSRGLMILQCFTPKTPELSVSAIARMTKLPQPTVWRLCYTMQTMGFLVGVAGRDTLRPGLPLLGLGYAVLASQPLPELALPAMQDIADRYGGAVSLGGRDGTNMIYLQRAQGLSIILDLRVGDRVPMAFSATGWAYLAALEEGEREAILTQIREQDRDRWAIAEPLFRNALEEYARVGYIVTKGMLHPQINSVAAPVRAADGSVLFGLSSGGISTEFSDATLRRLGLELKELAKTLGPALVTSAPPPSP
ncbi:IclR family transcriptional regulator [Bradyrhizobium jicamae]|uniref:IclR family transcriptional regulator n=1 Tax=Bradyrhizobium jicamae TaxID=280332 RepID=A0ABS5FUH5_9BRAD|nr:IclR family transcriptional regulator [Bradyrhizobium jicamae]MBR0800427.1 IclR family transcriptional regulator [Bradyrhizobium jicamae]